MYPARSFLFEQRVDFKLKPITHFQQVISRYECASIWNMANDCAWFKCARATTFYSANNVFVYSARVLVNKRIMVLVYVHQYLDSSRKPNQFGRGFAGRDRQGTRGDITDTFVPGVKEKKKITGTTERRRDDLVDHANAIISGDGVDWVRGRRKKMRTPQIEGKSATGSSFKHYVVSFRCLRA